MRYEHFQNTLTWDLMECDDKLFDMACYNLIFQKSLTWDLKEM